MGELTASLAHEVNQPLPPPLLTRTTLLALVAGDTQNLEEAARLPLGS